MVACNRTRIKINSKAISCSSTHPTFKKEKPLVRGLVSLGPEPNIFVFGVGMEYSRNRIGHKARQDLKFSNSFLFFFFFFLPLNG